MIPPRLVVAERIAAGFHEYYERHAQCIGYRTRSESRVDWDVVPEQNKWLMITVVYGLLMAGIIEPGPAARDADDPSLTGGSTETAAPQSDDTAHTDGAS